MDAEVKGLLGPAQRQARRAFKRGRVLRYLRQEVWSTQELLQRVMGLRSRQAAHATLCQMERESLVRRHLIATPLRRLTLWGITAHGQAFAFDPQTERPLEAVFEPAKLGLQNLEHALMVQEVRLRLEGKGWHDWINGDRLPALDNGDKRPDALVIDSDGRRVAIEVERTMKTLKRYRVVLLACLKAIRSGKYDRVMWVCPSQEMAERLKAVILSIEWVPLDGKKLPIEPHRHHANLTWRSIDSL